MGVGREEARDTSDQFCGFPSFAPAFPLKGPASPCPGKGVRARAWISGSHCDQVLLYVPCPPPPPTACRWSCALLTDRVPGTPTTGETSVSAGVQGEGGILTCSLADHPVLRLQPWLTPWRPTGTAAHPGCALRRASRLFSMASSPCPRRAARSWSCS